MIYITGDIHGSIDISKLNTTRFPENEVLTKKDYVIVCGDFGLVWSNSSEELYWRNWLDKKNFTTLFVDGNHENHVLLNKFSVEMWNGGKVHKINNSIIHLMRGQVFNIDGLKFFTMGGATSVDKQFRVKGSTWWEEEIPSKQEIDEALDNLEKNDWKVNYVISHTTSAKIMEIMCYMKESNALNSFFNMLENTLDFKHWYFGHFHDDVDIDNEHTLVYDRIIKII